ncbi:single-stranded DNA-binding protein [Thermaerobacter subterraneus]|uniref:Single-stranded DNA-binding protein n=1 Tax=Thermaerobacter subterraneus DSM 13965 TaxID=867903 RepID=K6PPE2_9FIRM|nr:single-stranded DNA-binding protein [Thermaerobacter subterraneus]EKP94787.1 single stranded DNA-binding protein [Thermaerobacter subterraneus DSM 13965]
MLNVVVLIGRLVRDPELRYTPSGVAVGGFTLAVDRPFANQQGEREADFIDIVVWRKLAETCANHLSKGRLVAVRGRLQVRSYETQDGQRRRVAEVVADDVRFLDRGPGGERSAPGGNSPGGEDLADFGDVTGLPDDDIPF